MRAISAYAKLKHVVLKLTEVDVKKLVKCNLPYTYRCAALIVFIIIFMT